MLVIIVINELLQIQTIDDVPNGTDVFLVDIGWPIQNIQVDMSVSGWLFNFSFQTILGAMIKIVKHIFRGVQPPIHRPTVAKRFQTLLAESFTMVPTDEQL